MVSLKSPMLDSAFSIMREKVFMALMRYTRKTPVRIHKKTNPIDEIKKNISDCEFVICI